MQLISINNYLLNKLNGRISQNISCEIREMKTTITNYGMGRCWPQPLKDVLDKPEPMYGPAPNTGWAGAGFSHTQCDAQILPCLLLGAL